MKPSALPNGKSPYHCHRWVRERKTFLRANPLCVRCGGVANVVDHIVPHKGNRKLFWDRSNWQPMCMSCHSSYKARVERSGPLGCGEDGVPYSGRW